MHASMSSSFGNIVLDGEIWYLPSPASSPLFSLLVLLFVFIQIFSFYSFLNLSRDLFPYYRCGRGLFLESHILLQAAPERADWGLSRYTFSSLLFILLYIHHSKCKFLNMHQGGLF